MDLYEGDAAISQKRFLTLLLTPEGEAYRQWYIEPSSDARTSWSLFNILILPAFTFLRLAL
jgi:hypothetical protein